METHQTQTTKRKKSSIEADTDEEEEIPLGQGTPKRLKKKDEREDPDKIESLGHETPSEESSSSSSSSSSSDEERYEEMIKRKKKVLKKKKSKKVVEDSDFEEPPKRVKKKKKEEEKLKKAKDESKKDICRHFLREKCNHGFRGKTPKDGVSECKFEHPFLCKKLLNHGMGPGGCQDGDNCKDIHPKMCRESLNTGKCPSSGRCQFGYHVKGTSIETKSTGNENVWNNMGSSTENVWNNMGANPTGNPNGGSGMNTSTFLEVLIRKEIQKIFQPSQNQGMPVMNWPML